MAQPVLPFTASSSERPNAELEIELDDGIQAVRREYGEYADAMLMKIRGVANSIKFWGSCLQLTFNPSTRLFTVCPLGKTNGWPMEGLIIRGTPSVKMGKMPDSFRKALRLACEAKQVRGDSTLRLPRRASF